MSYVLKPNFKIVIGATTITNDEATDITIEQGLSDQTGSFDITLANPYGSRTATVTPYAEVTTSVWYDGDSEVALLGGNVESIDYRISEGDIIEMSGRDYSHKFTFKKIKKTYQYEAVSDIITDIVTQLNTNLTTPFTLTGLPAAQENDNPAFGSTDPYDVSCQIFNLYDGNNVVAQKFTPNVPFIGAVTVRGNYVGNPAGSLACRLYEYDTDYATTIATASLLRGLGTASWSVDKMSEQFSASKLPTTAELAAATFDTINEITNSDGHGNAGIVFYARGFVRGFWCYLKKTDAPDQSINVSLYKALDASDLPTDDRFAMKWSNTVAGPLLASATVAASAVSTSASFILFDLKKSGLEMNGVYVIVVSIDTANLTVGSYLLARTDHSIATPALRAWIRVGEFQDNFHWMWDAVDSTTVLESEASFHTSVSIKWTIAEGPASAETGVYWVLMIAKDVNGVATRSDEYTETREDVEGGYTRTFTMDETMPVLADGTMTCIFGCDSADRWEGDSGSYKNRTYEFRIGSGTTNVVGADCACFDEGVLYWNCAYYFAVGESIMPEINIVLNAANIDTSKEHLLLFCCDTLGDISNHYRLLTDPDKNYNTTYYELKTAVTTRDLWFKVNSFQVSYEDKDAFEAMTEICEKIHHDWYVDSDKVVHIVQKGTGASQATFTVGDANVLDFTFTRDITRMKNYATYMGREKDIFEPYDRDKWTDINANRSGSWEVWTSSNVLISTYLDPFGVMVGKYTLRIYRADTTEAGTVYFPGNGTTGSGTFPSNLITNKYTCMAFYCVAVASDETPKVFRVGVNFNLTAGGTKTLYRHIWVESVGTNYGNYSLMSNWQYLTILLPQTNNINGWSTSATSEERGATSDYDWSSINYVAVYLYASDEMSASSMTGLHIDGFHFEGTGDNRAVYEDDDSIDVYDKREISVRDKNMDTTSDTTSAAMALIRRYGDHSADYTGTPGDSKDIQQQAQLTVVGRNDITPGEWITVVYSNASINQLYRVARVTHRISKSEGWTTVYQLDNINKIIDVNDIINGIRNSGENTSNAGMIDNGRYSNNISSSNAANIMK